MVPGPAATRLCRAVPPEEWTVSGIFAYIYMGAILTDRFCDTRQRDYRKADTDVGADVNGRPATSGRGAADLIPTHIDLVKRRP